MPHTISSNHLSHDTQVSNVIAWLDTPARDALQNAFPELNRLVWDGSWFDCEAMDVDVEFPQWVTDWIENNTEVYWSGGEPWHDGMQFGEDSTIADYSDYED